MLRELCRAAIRPGPRASLEALDMPTPPMPPTHVCTWDPHCCLVSLVPFPPPVLHIHIPLLHPNIFLPLLLFSSFISGSARQVPHCHTLSTTICRRLLWPRISTAIAGGYRPYGRCGATSWKQAINSAMMMQYEHKAVQQMWICVVVRTAGVRCTPCSRNACSRHAGRRA